MASSDLNSLEKCIEELEFCKLDTADDEIIYYCKICFPDNPPLPGNSNIAGCFTFDFELFASEIQDMQDTQPRSLRNLKSKIKKHS